MENESELICDRCKVALELITAQFSYLDRTFSHKVHRCPDCGQVYIPEDVVEEKMRKVETSLEDK